MPLPVTEAGKMERHRMHTVELLAQALQAAERLGYEVRQEWLGGAGGGACELRGRRILFLDLALAPEEQLEQMVEALGREAGAAALPLPAPLREALALRRSA
jgi:hypothetical protein